jgi:hypothetical protein
MTRHDFIEAAKEFTQLGWSVQEQAETLFAIADGGYTLDQTSVDSQLNSNAVDMIEGFVKRMIGLYSDEDEALEWEEVLEVIAAYKGEEVAA